MDDVEDSVLALTTVVNLTERKVSSLWISYPFVTYLWAYNLNRNITVKSAYKEPASGYKELPVIRN